MSALSDALAPQGEFVKRGQCGCKQNVAPHFVTDAPKGNLREKPNQLTTSTENPNHSDTHARLPSYVCKQALWGYNAAVKHSDGELPPKRR